MTPTVVHHLREHDRSGWSYPASKDFVPGALRLITVNNILSPKNATIVLSECRNLDLSQAGDTIPSYAAISHWWQQSSEVQRLSSIANRPLKISCEIYNDQTRRREIILHEISWHGLYQAAKAARHLQCDFLWLDLLCLDQCSKVDKKLQIQNMGHIYQKAKAVIVMPGGVSAAQDAEHDTKWITRAWTLQEASLCKNVHVLILYPKLDSRYKYIVSSTGPNYQIAHIDDHIALSKLDALLSCRKGGLKIEKVDQRTGKKSPVSFIVRCFGTDEALITALEGVLFARTPAMKRSAAWRSMWLRTSKEPQDMVFSVMHLLGVQIDVDYARTRESLVLELARKTASFPSWLDIGDAIPFDPKLGLVPALPEFHAHGIPTYHFTRRSVPVSQYIESGWSISEFDIKIVTPPMTSFDGDLICAEIFPIHYPGSGQPWISNGHGEKYKFQSHDNVSGSHVVIFGKSEIYGLAHLGLIARSGPDVYCIGKTRAGIWERLGKRDTIPDSFTGTVRRSHLRIGGHPGAEITPCNCHDQNITATGWSDWHMRVYFQDGQGLIRQAKHDDGVWQGGDSQSALFKAQPDTPLSAISWNNGQEIRIYYLNHNNCIREYCYSAGHGWYNGDLNRLHLEAASYSQISAIHWPVDNSIRVYFQEPNSYFIQEYCFSGRGKWQRGSTLQKACRGSRIAATRWMSGTLDSVHHNLHIRVYYQDIQSYIRELCWEVGGWKLGYFRCHAASHTSIAAISWYNGQANIRVFWQNQNQAMIESKFAGQQWVYNSSTVSNRTDSKSSFGAVQLQNGHQHRIYVREADNMMVEKCISEFDEGVRPWFNGAFQLK